MDTFIAKVHQEFQALLAFSLSRVEKFSGGDIDTSLAIKATIQL